MKTALSIFSTGISIVAVFVVLAVSGLLLLSKTNNPVGLRSFAVLSGSMEPAIPTGGLVFVKSFATYEPGDVLTVTSKIDTQRTVTHRVVSKKPSDEEGKTLYFLKGDANEDADQDPIEESQVVGKVVTYLPYVGKIIVYAQTQVGFIALVIIPATILAYSEILSIKNEVTKVFRPKETQIT